jgi:hypothetical protein
LIEAGHAGRHESLLSHLEGKAATEVAPFAPGYKQHLEASGDTFEHVRQTVMRVKKIVEGCGFATWQDVCKPGAATRIRAFVASLQQGETPIKAKTAAYYIP